MNSSQPKYSNFISVKMKRPMLLDDFKTMLNSSKKDRHIKRNIFEEVSVVAQLMSLILVEIRIIVVHGK